MRYLFPKSHRLLKRRDFLRARSSKKQFVGKYLLIDIRDNHLSHSRLGMTVTKRFGKANRRNHFKRLTREAFRLVEHQLPKGVDYHIRPRKYALEMHLSDAKSELTSFEFAT